MVRERHPAVLCSLQSFYESSSRGAKTVSHAIRLLGMNLIRGTCNSLLYVDALIGGYCRLKDALISSFVSALVVRRCAICTGRPDLAEDACICGMFHRLGKSLALHYFPGEFHEIEQLVEKNGLADKEVPMRVLGVGFGDLAMAVAAYWNFSASIKSPSSGRLAKPVGVAEIQQHMASFANELCEMAATVPLEEGLLQLSKLSIRFAGLIWMSPLERIVLLQAALKKFKEFSPAL